MADDRMQREQAAHSPDAIARRLARGPSVSYLKDFIYGAIDGAVTTFAVVSGVAGANLSSSIILILGVANLVADGFSMAISNYLGTRAEYQQRELVRQEENEEIQRFPSGEREEIRQIFARKGFQGQQLEDIVKVITADRERWVDTMLQEEHGLSLQPANPLLAGSATFSAFILIGSIPLITFVVNAWNPGLIENPFAWSAILTLLAFFIVGAFKGQFVRQPWYQSGAEICIIGALAAAIAYGAGVLLKSLVT